MRTRLLRTHEGGIIADIDPSVIVKKPTQICQENSAIRKPVNFYLNGNGTLEKAFVVDKVSLAINPNVLGKFGLTKIYVFYDVVHYELTKAALRKLPVSTSGIFGFHDILMQSFEENWSYFKLRLSHNLGIKEHQLERPSWHFITECYKFRGRPLVGPSDDRGLAQMPIEARVRHDELNGLREPIRNILMGSEVSETLVQDLKDRNIIIECSGDSDIRQEEIAEDKEEFLVFIFFKSSDLTELNLTIGKFKLSILPSLITDDRIRTIELSGSSFGSIPYNACCILHVVGNVSDLRDIVLEDLHKQMSNYSLQYGTRVVPIAEKLSSDQYNSLIETPVNDDEIGKTVHSIIHYLEGYEDAFMIKRLPAQQLVKLCQLYERYKEWIDDYEEFIRHKNLYLRNIDEFIYGIAYAYCSKEEEYSHPMFDHYVERFILNLSKIAENILQKVKMVKATEISLDRFSKLIGKVHPGYKHYDTNLGTLIAVINKWNSTHGVEHGRIGDDKLLSAFDNLQKFVNIRNTLAHDTDKGKPKTEELQNLTDLSEKAFDFVQNRYSIELIKSKNNNDKGEPPVGPTF